MPMLENSRHELFAQALAAGNTATVSYELAGYRPNDGNAVRMKGNESIIERISELRQRSAAKAETTLQGLLEDAAALQRNAAVANQFSAAIGALRLRAELSGNYARRKEHI